jgi:hypothetical protein
VAFLWKDAQGNVRQGAGLMRDVSVRGLFVSTAAAPPVGTPVRLEICFESAPAEPPVTVLAKGHICRVEEAGNGKRDGFAASTKRLMIRGNGGQVATGS